MAAVSGDEDAMTSVMALSRKAEVLGKSGHFARAAEKCAAAAAAAQSLQQPDSLIVAHLQLDEACKLQAHASACKAPADVAAALERIYFVLLPSMVAALQRRKAAVTLLPGACCARETTFFCDVQQYSSVILDHSPCEPAMLAQLGSLVGYATYVGAADIAMSYLLLPVAFDPRTIPLPAISVGQLATQHAFVLGALELVRQPRVLNDTCIGGEAGLIAKCRSLVWSSAAIDDALPTNWAQQLRDALQRLERSGLIQQRGMEQSLECFRQERAAAQDAAATNAAKRGLRRCALSSCGAREAHVSHFKLCSACKTVVYCSKAHQAEDWPAHKAACKAARKEAAAAAAEAGGAGGA
jgi:hypothetical protein